jgi:hypothetical protein
MTGEIVNLGDFRADRIRRPSPSRRQALLAVTSCPANLSPYGRMRRLAIVLGYSEGQAAAWAAPLRRHHLRVVAREPDPPPG